MDGNANKVVPCGDAERVYRLWDEVCEEVNGRSLSSGKMWISPTWGLSGVFVVRGMFAV